MKNNVVFCLVIILMISSCQDSARKTEVLPGIKLPAYIFNNQIELIPYPGMSEQHKNGEILFYSIENRSTNTIIFAEDFGVKVLIETDSGWEALEDNMKHPTGVNVLPPHFTDPLGIDIVVSPIVKDIRNSSRVRIVIVGHEKDRINVLVGAYIDVHYVP
jgi:hypothetical protein